METFEIAGTGLKPSRIGLGTWAIGGWMWGGSGEQDAIDTIHSAIERGITLIDTAPVYGFGRSEEIVGKGVADGERRRYWCWRRSAGSTGTPRRSHSATAFRLGDEAVKVG